MLLLSQTTIIRGDYYHCLNRNLCINVVNVERNFSVNNIYRYFRVINNIYRYFRVINNIYRYFRVMVFDVTFNNISVIS